MTAATAGERHRSRLKAELEEAIRRERRAVLILNTRSRRGAQAYGEAKRLLGESGFTLDASYPVRDASRLREVVAQALDYAVTVCDPREEYADTWNVAGATLTRDMPDDVVVGEASTAESPPPTTMKRWP